MIPFCFLGFHRDTSYCRTAVCAQSSTQHLEPWKPTCKCSYTITRVNVMY